MSLDKFRINCGHLDLNIIQWKVHHYSYKILLHDLCPHLFYSRAIGWYANLLVSDLYPIVIPEIDYTCKLFMYTYSGEWLHKDEYLYDPLAESL